MILPLPTSIEMKRLKGDEEGPRLNLQSRICWRVEFDKAHCDFITASHIASEAIDALL